MAPIFKPKMLVLGRESRGLTQSALAARSGIAQGTISKAENGQLEPTLEMLSRWADALDVPTSFFAQDATFHPSVVFYRKQASLPAGAAKIIHANVGLMQMRISSLANSVEIPGTLPSETLEPKGRRRARDVASELRIAWRLPEGPVGNLTKLVEDHGVVVVRMDFGSEKISGMSLRQPGDPPTVFLNTMCSADRLRFTLAHELAHLVLHHHLPLPPEESEDEADEFASEFLMPTADIRHEIPPGLTLQDLAQLKVRWKVSMSALIRKAAAVGKLSDAGKQRLYKRFSALGYRRHEPIELDHEFPSMVPELLRVHREDLGFSETELLGSLHANRSEFDAKFSSSAPRLRRVK